MMSAKKLNKRAVCLSIIFCGLIWGLLLNFGSGVRTAEAVGGAYTITFRAIKPGAYIPPIPYPGTVQPITDGRADGSLSIPGADYSEPTTSLEPQELSLCQIVPFLFKIDVDGDTTPEDGSIVFKASWGTVTTSGSDFGYDEDYMVYSAFVDTSDSVFFDPDENALVSKYSAELVEKNGTVVSFEGTFQVDGLDDGDVVMVEAWVVLECDIPDKVTGNVHSALTEAYTNPPDPFTPQTISTGEQTNPLLQVSQFETAQVDLGVYKFDDNNPKSLDVATPYPYYSEPWKNTIVVDAESVIGSPYDFDYIANEVIITDILDPWVELLSDEPFDDINDPNGYTIDPMVMRSCSWVDENLDGFGGTLTCDLQAISEGESVTITYWVRAVPGVAIDSSCEGTAEINPATSVAEECPVGYDVMNRVDLTTLSDDINSDDNWDEEPKDISQPTAVDLLSFKAKGAENEIIISWETATEIDNLGFNLYRAQSPNGVRSKLNVALIPTQTPPGSLIGATYVFVDTGSDLGPEGLIPYQTYYYWLEDVDLTGGSKVHGPAEATLLRADRPEDSRIYLPMFIR